MKVHPSSAGDVAAAQLGQGAAALASILAPAKASAAHASAAKASTHKAASHKSQHLFASVLAQASPAPTVSSTDVAPKAITPRKGETLTPVGSHGYSLISGGARDGMYINTTNNSRRGMAFVLAFKNGREYHIYGTGKDRLVVALRKPVDAATIDATPVNTATGTGGATPTVSAS